MTASWANPDYALGSTDAEHERLVRQAARLAPLTERFFRDAGIGPGQRVLDLGSGVGDVAMLAARIVGPTGSVVGVDRDSRAIARARTRVVEAGLHHVSFSESDVSEISTAEPFDAAVGRYILMYLPDPVVVLRSLSRLVRPGGVLAFQEPSWAPVFALSSHLPLWSACASLIVETFQSSKVNTEMGPALLRVFQQAGLPAPHMHMEVLLGNEPDFTRGIHDILRALHPRIGRLNLAALGDFETLPQRLYTEVTASKGVASWLALVEAWSRKPSD